MTFPTLLLTDTASLYFRAFYGVPDRAPEGSPPVNAIRGLLDMLATLVTNVAPTELVCCWDDDWRPAFRVAALPSYKAHRLASTSGEAEEVPDRLAPQVPVIAELLDAIGVWRMGAAGMEADDVIGTLATRHRSRLPVTVVTGDRDLFQLVGTDGAVTVLYTGKGGVRAPDIVDCAWLQSKYGIADGAAYELMATLRGDASDGLPGVAGVGEKTAAQLASTYGTLEAVRAAASDPASALGPAVRRALTASSDYLDVAPLVVRVVRDAPLEPGPYPLPTRVADPQRVLDIASRYDIASPLNRLLAALRVEV